MRSKRSRTNGMNDISGNVLRTITLEQEKIPDEPALNAADTTLLESYARRLSMNEIELKDARLLLNYICRTIVSMQIRGRDFSCVEMAQGFRHMFNATRKKLCPAL